MTNYSNFKWFSTCLSSSGGQIVDEFLLIVPLRKIQASFVTSGHLQQQSPRGRGAKRWRFGFRVPRRSLEAMGSLKSSLISTGPIYLWVHVVAELRGDSRNEIGAISISVTFNIKYKYLWARHAPRSEAKTNLHVFKLYCIFQGELLSWNHGAIMFAWLSIQ